MKSKNTVYWTTTILVMLIMTISGALALTRTPAMMGAITHLGYPAYFATLLGVAKLVGVCVVLAPGYALAKEWGYTGFGILILSASYSHALSHDGLSALEPVVVFCLLTASYVTRPANRRLELLHRHELSGGAQ